MALTRHQVQLDATLAGPLLMLSAALLFTLLNLIVKLLGPAFTVWSIGFYRFFGGAVVLIAVFGRHKNPYRGVNTRLLIIRGCSGCIAFICVVMAIRLLPVSTAMIIFYSFPAFSAIFSFLIYRERIRFFESTLIAMVLVGVGVLFDFQLGGELLGQTFALMGAVLAGLTVTLIRTLREKNGPVIIYLYLCTTGILATAPMFILHPVWPATPMEWGMILGLVLSSVMAQLLMNQGFFYCRGWEGGVFLSSEVVFTAVAGITFLGDPVTWRLWCGGLMILISVAALNRLSAFDKRKADAASP